MRLPSHARSQIETILDDSLTRLKMVLAVVSRVIENDYLVVATVDRNGVVRANNTYALDGVYCSAVIASGAPLAMTECDGVPGLKRHPLYMPMCLEAYLGAPIFRDGAIWGTLNFTSPRIREMPFSQAEVAHAVERAAGVAAILNASGV
jgi:GAF domain-containing protein